MKTNSEIAQAILREASLWRAARRLAPVMQVRQIMAKKGIKNVDLAERLGVTEANISRLLKGDKNLQLDTLHQLSDAIGEELNIAFGPIETASVQDSEIEDHHAEEVDCDVDFFDGVEEIPSLSFSNAPGVFDFEKYRLMRRSFTQAPVEEDLINGQDFSNESRTAYA
ncbi:helix-turn-helix domain-containing protein [Cupriavidus oxalaticus]|uniref:helix-turn-helix domain-containing protein n=1 Tax=Cupriavidus oxalaticus TaxID=96344 RepID=UPI004034B3C5